MCSSIINQIEMTTNVGESICSINVNLHILKKHKDLWKRIFSSTGTNAIATYWGWGWNEKESLEAIAESLESTDLARCIPPADRWRRHLKEPTCVVGEHRQFHLSLEDFKVIAFDVVGVASILECFWRSSTFKSVIFMWRITLIRAGFFSTLSSIFFLSMLL